MKRFLSLVLTACLLVCCAAVGAQGAEKVYALTMGVRKYSVNNTVSDGRSVAVITYTRLSDGSSGSANTIFDVQYGETFELTSALAQGQEKYYMFLGWFDGDGVLLTRDAQLHIRIEHSTAVFAAYAEIGNRFVLTYSCVGEGRLSVSSDRALMEGEGCVSVLSGANATISITPAKNHLICFIKVNGHSTTMIANTVQRLTDAVQNKDVKGVFNALFNYVRFLLAKKTEFTIYNITDDTTFEVGFIKPYFEKR